jgi:HNH endonuclease
VDYTNFLATRIAYFLTTGGLPLGKVMHACDNPSCVNPGNLIDDTNRDNAYDRAMKQFSSMR